MKHDIEWFKYDPSDPTTHPPDYSQIVMEGSNGRKAAGVYGYGIFCVSFCVSLEPLQAVRWGYLPQPIFPGLNHLVLQKRLHNAGA